MSSNIEKINIKNSQCIKGLILCVDIKVYILYVYEQKTTVLNLLVRIKMNIYQVWI